MLIRRLLPLMAKRPYETYYEKLLRSHTSHSLWMGKKNLFSYIHRSNCEYLINYPPSRTYILYLMFFPYKVEKERVSAKQFSRSKAGKYSPKCREQCGGRPKTSKYQRQLDLEKKRVKRRKKLFPGIGQDEASQKINRYDWKRYAE